MLRVDCLGRSDWHSARRVGLHRTTCRRLPRLRDAPDHRRPQRVAPRSVDAPPGITAVQFAAPASCAARPCRSSCCWPASTSDRASCATAPPGRRATTSRTLPCSTASRASPTADRRRQADTGAEACPRASPGSSNARRQDPWGLAPPTAPRAHLWFLVVLMLVVAAAGYLLARARVGMFVAHRRRPLRHRPGTGLYSPGPSEIVWQGWRGPELLLQAPLFFAVGVVPRARARAPAALQWQATVLIAAGLALPYDRSAVDQPAPTVRSP